MTEHIYIVYREGWVWEWSKLGQLGHLKLDQPLYQCDPLYVTSDSHDDTVAHYLWWDHFQGQFRKRDTGISTQFFGLIIKW